MPLFTPYKKIENIESSELPVSQDSKDFLNDINKCIECLNTLHTFPLIPVSKELKKVREDIRKEIKNPNRSKSQSTMDLATIHGLMQRVNDHLKRHKVVEQLSKNSHPLQEKLQNLGRFACFRADDLAAVAKLMAEILAYLEPEIQNIKANETHELRGKLIALEDFVKKLKAEQQQVVACMLEHIRVYKENVKNTTSTHPAFNSTSGKEEQTEVEDKSPPVLPSLEEQQRSLNLIFAETNTILGKVEPQIELSTSNLNTSLLSQSSLETSNLNISALSQSQALNDSTMDFLKSCVVIPKPEAEEIIFYEIPKIIICPENNDILLAAQTEIIGSSSKPQWYYNPYINNQIEASLKLPPNFDLIRTTPQTEEEKQLPPNSTYDFFIYYTKLVGNDENQTTITQLNLGAENCNEAHWKNNVMPPPVPKTAWEQVQTLMNTITNTLPSNPFSENPSNSKEEIKKNELPATSAGDANNIPTLAEQAWEVLETCVDYFKVAGQVVADYTPQVVTDVVRETVEITTNTAYKTMGFVQNTVVPMITDATRTTARITADLLQEGAKQLRQGTETVVKGTKEVSCQVNNFFKTQDQINKENREKEEARIAEAKAVKEKSFKDFWNQQQIQPGQKTGQLFFQQIQYYLIEVLELEENRIKLEHGEKDERLKFLKNTKEFIVEKIEECKVEYEKYYSTLYDTWLKNTGPNKPSSPCFPESLGKILNDECKVKLIAGINENLINKNLGEISWGECIVRALVNIILLVFPIGGATKLMLTGSFFFGFKTQARETAKLIQDNAAGLTTQMKIEPLKT